MVITVSPRAKGRERIRTGDRPVCGMQCTWTSEPAKPRFSHCTGTPLGVVARGRSLSDQINSDMSTDITGHHMWTHSCGEYALVGRCGLCFGVGERQSTTACMSFSGPAGPCKT